MLPDLISLLDGQLCVFCGLYVLDIFPPFFVTCSRHQCSTSGRPNRSSWAKFVQFAFGNLTCTGLSVQESGGGMTNNFHAALTKHKCCLPFLETSSKLTLIAVMCVLLSKIWTARITTALSPNTLSRFTRSRLRNASAILLCPGSIAKAGSSVMGIGLAGPVGVSSELP